MGWGKVAVHVDWWAQQYTTYVMAAKAQTFCCGCSSQAFGAQCAWLSSQQENCGHPKEPKIAISCTTASIAHAWPPPTHDNTQFRDLATGLSFG
eukprot:157981-Amphidinium_carterae.1